MLKIAHRSVWSVSVAILAAWFGMNLLMAQDLPGKGLGQRGQREAAFFDAGTVFSPQGIPSVKRPATDWSGKVQFDEDSGRDAAIHELLEKFATTDGEDERKKLADELEKVVGEQFDLRQKTRADELKELEDQLAELRKLHEKRSNQKGMIVRERARQLLRDADGLGWNNNAPGRSPSAGKMRIDASGRPAGR